MVEDRDKSFTQHGDNSWTLTFVDLLSLLLAFFVLLFSMSEVKTAGWDSFVSSLQSQFQEKAVTLEDIPKSPESRSETGEALNIFYLSSLLKSDFQNDPLFDGGQITVEGGQLILDFPAKNLFVPDGYLFISGGQKKISGLGTKLAQLPNTIIIEAIVASDATVYRPYRTVRERATALSRAMGAGLKTAGFARSFAMVGKVGPKGSGPARVRVRILSRAEPKGHYGAL